MLTILSWSSRPLLSVVITPSGIIILVTRAWIAHYRVGLAMRRPQLEVIKVLLILASLRLRESPVGGRRRRGVLAAPTVSAAIVSPVVLAANEVGNELIRLLVGSWRWWSWWPCSIAIEVIVRRTTWWSVGGEIRARTIGRAVLVYAIRFRARWPVRGAVITGAARQRFPAIRAGSNRGSIARRIMAIHVGMLAAIAAWRRVTKVAGTGARTRARAAVRGELIGGRRGG